MIKEFAINDILNAVNVISKLKKKEFSRRNRKKSYPK